MFLQKTDLHLNLKEALQKNKENAVSEMPFLETFLPPSSSLASVG